MKTCPVCGARCFDDMEVCYGCLHAFAFKPPSVLQEAMRVALPRQEAPESIVQGTESDERPAGFDSAGEDDGFEPEPVAEWLIQQAIGRGRAGGESAEPMDAEPDEKRSIAAWIHLDESDDDQIEVSIRIPARMFAAFQSACNQ